MANQYVMGIDIGTSGCKTLIIDDRGRVVARATEEYPLSTPHPGWSEQNPEHWWQAVRTTVQRVTHQFEDTGAIKGIGLSGQMHGLVALDSSGHVLRPCILWNDQRTGRQCQEIHQAVGGIAKLLKLDQQSDASRLHRREDLVGSPERTGIYEKIRFCLNPKDYIRFTAHRRVCHRSFRRLGDGPVRRAQANLVPPPPGTS